MPAPKGLGNVPRLTQNSLLEANANTVAGLRGGASEKEFGDLWGVSPGTVGNTHNKNHGLSQYNFLKLGERFGTAGVNPALALIGLVAFPMGDVEIDVGEIPQEIAEALPLIMKLLSDGECCERDWHALEAAGVADAFIKFGDFFRAERSKRRSGAS